MQQYLIAIDLDGTTLNKQSQLTELTIKTLRYLDALGHMVVIATGRPYRTSKHLYQQLNISNPMINFNGALCHFPGNIHWLPSYHETLDKAMAFELMSRQQDLDIDLLMAEGKDKLYSSSMNLPDSPYDPFMKDQVVELSPSCLIDDPTALSIFCEDDKQEGIVQRLMDQYGDKISVRTWGGDLPLLEIVRHGIHKATGVARIADFYRVPQDHILAFGDENNDLEMIAYAGHGVAMANAIEEIKAVADAITPYGHDQDGLARYLIDYFDLSFRDLVD